MKTILLIGQNGQVTRYLQKGFIESERHNVTVVGREKLDLTKLETIKPVLQTIKPDIIVNPAAYTAVDSAEKEQDAAFCINRDAVAKIADYCAVSNTPLIHFSTDYVFAGDAKTPYVETDAPKPTGIYGQSKLEGEQAVLSSLAPALVLRTSWVYSNYGHNFYKTMLNLAKTRDQLSIVTDQIGAPTYAGSIANATWALLKIVLDQGNIKDEQRGIYHLTCQGETSWYGFAKALFKQNGVSHLAVNPIPTSEYPTPAKRPAYSVLNNEKLERVFGVSLPRWQDALNDCVNESKALDGN